jgi:hypothetical protein
LTPLAVSEKPFWSRRKSSRGQSLAEFALFIPVVAVLLLIAIDVGRAYLGWVTLTNVARIGANFAAQNPDAWSGTGDATVQARYRTLMSKDATGIDCSLPTTLPAPTWLNSGASQYSIGSRVQVTLNCKFRLMTPFLARGFDAGVFRINGIGDSNGDVSISSSAVFAIRSGSVNGVIIDASTPTSAPSVAPTTVVSTPTPSPSPTPTAAPTPTPTLAPGQTPTPTPNATPTPTPAPTPTPIVVSFYGSSTTTDASGGGPPGSINESQIVGVPSFLVTFVNTTVGASGSCDWDFGDGSRGSYSCGSNVQHTYSTRGTYNVSLSVQGTSLTRSSYVLSTCKVPAFAGVRVNSASTTWTSAGFTGTLTQLNGNGNYKIGFQSLVGGLVNPQGGCGASIQVGP